MEYQLNDFLELRTRFIKNCILNRLLIAQLKKQQTPIDIGTALYPVNRKLRSIISKEKGPNTKHPRFIMANIVAQLDSPLLLGYFYSHYPIIWTSKFEFNFNLNMFGKLKALAQVAATTYTFNPSNFDKIFSAPPKSLVTLLNQDSKTSKYWILGFSWSILKFNKA